MNRHFHLNYMGNSRKYPKSIVSSFKKTITCICILLGSPIFIMGTHFQGSHFLESPGNWWISGNVGVLEFGMMTVNCSISLKFEIPSTFLGKISWKLTQKCPGN